MAAGPDAPYRGGLGAPSTEEVDAMRSRYETGAFCSLCKILVMFGNVD